ncbi:hypothetical protein [Actinoallomurus sp. NPDC052274]|uniref:hypothetical protein n=1 Tax=Actinoallomurus sp. NPDC052274 TaxID=3155420 RepID=UPI0034452179
MAVTDEQVATLRAYLAGEFDQYEQLNARLDPGVDGMAYGALIAAGLFEAVDRRFAKGATRAQVVDYVGDVRSRSERLSEEIDPQVAERLIMHSLGEGSIDDIDDGIVVHTQLLLLIALVGDERLDDAGLDKFMATTRALGNRLLS